MNDGPLDMGMGQNNMKVSDIINTYSEKELANIIYKYGEERFSRRIAKNIIEARKIKIIEVLKNYLNKLKVLQLPKKQ